MARNIGVHLMVDYRCVSELLELVLQNDKMGMDIWVRGVQGVMAVFNVSYTKAEQLIKGVLRPSIYRDEIGLISMNLKKAYDLYYNGTSKE